MTREKFIQLAKNCLITEAELMNYINKVLDCYKQINLDEVPDDYRAVYPLIAAIFEVNASYIVNGSSDEKTRREMRRKTNKLKSSIIWG